MLNFEEITLTLVASRNNISSGNAALESNDMLSGKANKGLDEEDTPSSAMAEFASYIEMVQNKSAADRGHQQLSQPILSAAVQDIKFQKKPNLGKELGSLDDASVAQIQKPSPVRAPDSNIEVTLSEGDEPLSKNLMRDLNLSPLPARAVIITDEAISLEGAFIGSRRNELMSMDILAEDVPTLNDLANIKTDNWKMAKNSDVDTVIRGQKEHALTAMNTQSLNSNQIMSGFGVSDFAQAAAGVNSVQTLNGAAPISWTLTSLNSSSLNAVAATLVKTAQSQQGISVRLNPPEMGRIYIDYKFDPDKSVQAVIRADLPEVIDQLRTNSSHLESFLKQNGFEGVTLIFEQDQSNAFGAGTSDNFDEQSGFAFSYDTETDESQNLFEPAESAASIQQMTSLSGSIDIKL